MDSPPALSARRARGGHCICNSCARQSWPKRIDNRSTHLDDEYRHHRKRPVNRDRSALCFPMRSCDHLLVKLLDSKEIRMAHLDSCIHFSWAWLPRERSYASRIFLWDRAGRALADEELATSLSSCALRRAHHHACHLCGLGHSLCQEHGHAGRGIEMVDSIRRPTGRYGF